MNTMQKICFGMLLILLCSFFSVELFASADTEYLFDEYQVFSSEEFEKVHEILQKASQKDNIDYVVMYSLPFEDTDEETYEKYVNFLHKEKGYRDTTLVMLVDYENREITIHGFGRMKPIFRDPDNVDYVTDNVGPFLRSGDFTIAVTEFISRGRILYRSFYKSKLEKFVDGMFSLKNLGISLLIAFLTGVSLYALHNQKVKAGAANYEVANSFRLEREEDLFSHITRSSRTISSSSSGGGGGGGSSSGGSSGGTRSF